ncbi:DUF5691 domain-containing protein [Roseisolibacter agri]|uniref:HEAT repeat protein n=1 Tax=Roseisolibacter agri TaxID=2014610 RepID=A0AA37V0P3_9BACT|nr:DUF5691 domain-containing protein [Roseisolibacter agri]GLC24910.1 hypothetical protein rosag_14230 [Roseisolibacter agri]
MTSRASAVAAWAGVVQAALLGSTRTSASLDAAPPDVAALLHALDARDTSTERRLLARAAVLSAYVRAGRLPARRATPPDDPAPVDDAPVVPPAAARLLATLLVGEHRDVLPEWLARAAAGGWRAPSPLLPALLDLARAAPALQPDVVRVLGARGRWLAARHPDWSWAAGTSSDTARATWETGAPPARVMALATLRADDAAAARELLAATWRTESAAGRAKLLAALETSLGPDDEPFLEAALDDRSREVRAVAAGLLASLPGSALVARMTERARAALRYEAGGLLRRARLVVTLPGAPDEAAVRDGVQPAPPPGIGERAWWLSQIVAAVPPAAWTAAWGLGAERVVTLLRDDEWTQPLADGWARAALRHRDAEWADALLRANVLVDRHARLAPPRAALLGLLPPARREALLVDALVGRVGVSPVELLHGAPPPWGDALARHALTWYRRRATGATGLGVTWATDAPVAESLPMLATRIPPALADEASNGWPAEPAPPWPRAIERFQSLLALRRALHAAFTP